MKKTFLFSLLLAIACIMTTGCSSCQSENNKQEAVSDTLQVAELVVENTVSTDKQYMYVNYGSDYRYYETCILLKDFLDTEDCDGSIEGISNVFQYVTQIDSTSFDVQVVLSAYANGKHAYEVKDAFWVGDEPMNDQAIKITYKEAYEKVLESNYPKPHSRHCVLRKECGPVEAAPQYIFGNTRAQLYVDATTGNVTDKNPAFGDFGMPLGEWP